MVLMEIILIVIKLAGVVQGGATHVKGMLRRQAAEANAGKSWCSVVAID